MIIEVHNWIVATPLNTGSSYEQNDSAFPLVEENVEIADADSDSAKFLC